MSSLSYLETGIGEHGARSPEQHLLRRTVAILLAVMVAGGSTTYGFYRRDLKVARNNALAGGTVVRTACGPIEYAIKGTGRPVLVIHGTGGGWDQGLFIARGLVDRGYQVIAPSRYGYLRTPMPAHPSARAEADMFVCLLDELKIDRVGVIAASAGATPALQLALHYPERMSSLVLLVPAIGGISPPDTVARVSAVVMNVVLGLDLPYWAAMRFWPSVSYKLVAVPDSLVPTLSRDDRRQLDEAIEMMLPITWRRRGIVYDAQNQMSEPPYPLRNITVPTLLISAEDDLYKTLPNARVAATAIPGARLVEVKSGGHLLLGHDTQLWPTIADFMLR
jgi:pimeloyl-ACP methyl ester carboxylesterase